MSSALAVYAINCGSDSFETDSRGVKYQKDDSLYYKSCNMTELIVNVPAQDQRIYQTHAWTTNGRMVYKIPIFQDGDYTLSVMLYNHHNQDNTSVLLNRICAVANLSVFDLVGPNVAHVEKIKFRIRGNQLEFAGQRSKLSDNCLSVELISPKHLNIMVSALVLEREF
jgi:hypothetical protein